MNNLDVVINGVRYIPAKPEDGYISTEDHYRELVILEMCNIADWIRSHAPDDQPVKEFLDADPYLRARFDANCQAKDEWEKTHGCKII